jgi:hypothetical protein
MSSPDYLAIYLNDHLGGAAGGVELVRRLHDSNREDETFGPPLARLQEEIEAKRAALERLAEQLDISRGLLKPLGAWVLEKVSRLKPNGQLHGYSPLSRVLELEGLAIGLSGQLGLWRTLIELDLKQPGFDFERLAAETAEHRATVEDLHRRAANAIA